MKLLIVLFFDILLASNASALTITNKWHSLIKFDIKLHTDDGGDNIIFKQVLRYDSIAMPTLLAAYEGSLFSVVIHDYDYSRTTSTCIDHLKRNDNIEVIYIGGGKCKVSGADAKG